MPQLHLKEEPEMNPDKGLEVDPGTRKSSAAVGLSLHLDGIVV